MRRWTVLLIPHDTDQSRSFAVSGSVLRIAASVAALVVLAAVIGVGSIAAWVARPGTRPGAGRAGLVATRDSSPTEAQVDSLRATVHALRGTLDTIRQADARLTRVAGIEPSDTATLRTFDAIRGSRAAADTLLRGAKVVARRLGSLADSAALRAGQRRVVPSATEDKREN